MSDNQGKASTSSSGKSEYKKDSTTRKKIKEQPDKGVYYQDVPEDQRKETAPGKSQSKKESSSTRKRIRELEDDDQDKGLEDDQDKGLEDDQDNGLEDDQDKGKYYQDVTEDQRNITHVGKSKSKKETSLKRVRDLEDDKGEEDTQDVAGDDQRKVTHVGKSKVKREPSTSRKRSKDLEDDKGKEDIQDVSGNKTTKSWSFKIPKKEPVPEPVPEIKTESEGTVTGAGDLNSSVKSDERDSDDNETKKKAKSEPQKSKPSAYDVRPASRSKPRTSDQMTASAIGMKWEEGESVDFDEFVSMDPVTSTPPRSETNCAPNCNLTPIARSSPGLIEESSSTLVGQSPQSFSLNNSLASIHQTSFNEENQDDWNLQEDVQNVGSLFALDGSLADQLWARQREEEPMDWGDEMDSSLLEEINRLREIKRETNEEQNIIPGSVLSLPHSNSTGLSSLDSAKPLMIVIDTNVFLSQLFQVEKMLNDLATNLVLYVPWAVLNELDSLSKSQREIKFKAIKATQFLQKHLSEKNPRISGQTGALEREAESLFNASNADDRILQSCLQLQKLDKQVLLNTNDRNLATKALVSDVKAFSSAGLLKELNGTNNQTDTLSFLKGPVQQHEQHHLAVRQQQSVLLPQQLHAPALPSKCEVMMTDEELGTKSTDLSEIEDLFNRLWLTIYKIVVSYCCSFKIDYVSQTCARIEEGLRLPQPNPNEVEPHLKLLTRLLKQVVLAYQRFLSTDPVELSTNHDSVIQLHLEVTTFTTRLTECKPASHPDLPYFSPTSVPLEKLFCFLSIQGNHEILAIGYSQLVELKNLAATCLNTFQEPKAFPPALKKFYFTLIKCQN